MMRKNRRGREGGAAAVEMVGVMPLALIGGIAALQVGAAGWTVVATGQAARDAARAASIGQDPRAAAEDALPGAIELVEVNGSRVADGYSYDVAAKVPTLIPLDLGEVTRTADMPDIR